jgi:hypothetical protein
MNTCKDCQFAVTADGTDKATAGEGFCRRYPPAAMIEGEQARSTFPPVALQFFWCGELVVTRQATSSRKKARSNA